MFPVIETVKPFKSFYQKAHIPKKKKKSKKHYISSKLKLKIITV